MVQKLTYLFKAAMDKRQALIADLGYAYAYYFKGYIAVEQKDTRAALENPLDLCPDNSQFLSELANLYKGARDCATAMVLYTGPKKVSRFPATVSIVPLGPITGELKLEVP